MCAHVTQGRIEGRTPDMLEHIEFKRLEHRAFEIELLGRSR